MRRKDYVVQTMATAQFKCSITGKFALKSDKVVFNNAFVQFQIFSERETHFISSTPNCSLTQLEHLK